MEFLINAVLIAAAIYGIVWGVMVNTGNTRSFILFKVGPLIMGIAAIVAVLFRLGFIIAI